MYKQQKVTGIFFFLIKENDSFNWEEGVVNLPKMTPGNNIKTHL